MKEIELNDAREEHQVLTKEAEMNNSNSNYLEKGKAK